jgi:hypothetical protein
VASELVRYIPNWVPVSLRLRVVKRTMRDFFGEGMVRKFLNVLLVASFGGILGVSIRADAQAADDPAALRQDIDADEQRILGKAVEEVEAVGQGVVSATTQQARRDLAEVTGSLEPRRPTAVPDDSLEEIREDVKKLEQESQS